MHKMNAYLKKMIALLACCALVFAALPVNAFAVSLASAPMRSGNTQNGMVRVRLSSLGNPSKLNLTVYGSYTVNGKSSSTIKSGSSVTVNFDASSGKLTLTVGGSTQDMGSSFKLRRHATSGDNGIKIAQGRVPGNLYPGDFYFVVKGSAGNYTLYTIAYIYMEDYLYGVLPYEMGNSSGLEALKAQAVAARTYTMRAMSAASSSLYDVVDTTSDQVYSGTPSGNANCKAAVDATKGIVAKNGSNFTATYYTASNGGQTESVKNAWGSSQYSYLGVKDDPYDLANSASRKNSFTVNASGTQSNATLGSLLNQKAASKFGSGATVTAVSAVTPHTPKYASPSKLYTKLDFSVTYYRNGSYGQGTLTFDIFNELESPLGMSINSGSNELWSVEKTSSGFTVYARRYGHGIGMSQRGAMYMSQIGYTYDQILAFYFEGCERIQYTLTRSILSPVISGQDSYEQVFEEDPAELEGAKDGTAKVFLSSASGSVYLLSAANASASSLIAIPHGATVQVYGQSGSYILCGYGSLCGYLPASSLSITGSIPSSSGKAPTVLYGYGTVVNSNALNLRAAANMNSTVYTTIPGGQVLPVFSVSGNWAYVQYGLRTGYVSLDYISLSKNHASPTQQPGNAGSATGITARVNTAKGSLNLRASASDTAKVLTTIPQYATITILEKGSTWCKTMYGGYTGYVMTKFLTFLSASATQAPVIVTPTPTQAPSSGSSALYARVNTAQGSLNLRAMAADNAMVLRTIPQYEVIQILEKGSTWCKTTYGGYTGFVMTKFLTFLSSAPTATQAPTLAPTASVGSNSTLYARVDTAQGSLNLRYAAKSSARVLTTIPQYTYIPILEQGSLWCKTTYGGHTGYVMTSFLTFVNMPSSSVPTQVPTLAPTKAPSSSDVSYARVTTAQGSLNLREKAQSYAKVLTTIPQYDLVEVLEKGASWCKVVYNGHTGYVMSQYLTHLSSAPAATATPRPTQTPAYSGSGDTARVNTTQGSLNLRENAWDTAPVIGTIPQGEIVVVLEYGTPFCHVLYNGQSGYVMTQYLAFGSGSASAPTATPRPTQAPVSSGLIARVTTVQGSLNLRATASDYAQVLTTIPQYAVISVLSRGASWCQVSYNGYTGYVKSQYLTFLSSSAGNSQGGDSARDATLRTLTNPVTGRVVTQTGTKVNLRAGCASDATVILQMIKSDFVVITAVGDTWCAVQYEGRTGYCMREYLEFDLNE